MIHVTDTITIDENELRMKFVRSSGPGGQNVNKVATAVQLKFDVLNSPSLPDAVRYRLLKSESRVRKNGEIMISADRYRLQEQNREDAVERLTAMIRKASVAPRKRKKTRPSLAAKQRRLDVKRRRSGVKKTRKPVSAGDE